MIIIDCIQGSEEWFAARLGMVTASNFGKVLNKKTGRGLYMYKVAAERAWRIREKDAFCNKNMEHGNLAEAEARDHYAKAFGPVQQVGFVKRDDYVGGSPDGLVGEEGLIEIKCPIPSTHAETIDTRKMDTKYIPQVQGLLWVTGRQWCDFVSFIPDALSRPIFTIRIERDEKKIIEIAASVRIFVEELKDKVTKIQGDF